MQHFFCKRRKHQKPGTQPRTLRRHLLALGVSPDRVHGDGVAKAVGG